MYSHVLIKSILEIPQMIMHADCNGDVRNNKNGLPPKWPRASEVERRAAAREDKHCSRLPNGAAAFTVSFTYQESRDAGTRSASAALPGPGSQQQADNQAQRGGGQGGDAEAGAAQVRAQNMKGRLYRDEIDNARPCTLAKALIAAPISISHPTGSCRRCSSPRL
jgi:hypothetical protein